MRTTKPKSTEPQSAQLSRNDFFRDNLGMRKGTRITQQTLERIEALKGMLRGTPKVETVDVTVPLNLLRTKTQKSESSPFRDGWSNKE